MKIQHHLFIVDLHQPLPPPVMYFHSGSSLAIYLNRLTCQSHLLGPPPASLVRFLPVMQTLKLLSFAVIQLSHVCLVSEAHNFNT